MEIYKGRGTKKENRAVVEAMDRAFFKTASRTFPKLLPKLYKDKYNPALNNFIVKEDNKVKAAVGLFYNDLYINGERLLLGGIGNVGVVETARGKGYMKDCMNMALEDMLEKGCDFAELGGQRQRYRYFGFETGGDMYEFRFHINNFRHTFGKDIETQFEFVRLKNNDAENIQNIYNLQHQGDFYVDRKPESTADILRSWKNVPVVLMLNGTFRGYAVFENENKFVNELRLVHEADLKDALLAVFKYYGSNDFEIGVPKFEKAFIDFCTPICERVISRQTGNYAVFHYRRTVKAFLELKAKTQPLCDGRIVLDIHGLAGREKIEICVQNNQVSVEETDQDADMELAHLDAVGVIFGYHIRQNDLPANVASWFPLPIFIHDADRV